MTKKIIIIVFMTIFLFQGIMLTAADEAKKEVPKKILKKMKKAAKYLEKAKKEVKPEKKDSYFNDALKQYDEVLKIDDKFAAAYFQKAVISFTKKDLKSTVELLKKTIALDPGHEKAQSTLAQIYLSDAKSHQQKKDYVKMLECQQKFIDMPFAKEKMANEYSMNLYLMGVYNSMLKNFKKGNEYLTKHVELFKDKTKSQTYHFAIYTIGINYITLMDNEMNKENAKKDIKKAKVIALKYADIEKYLSETVKAPKAKWTEDANLRLGTYYIYKGDKDKAKATIENLIKLYPNSKDIEVYKNILKNTVKK